MKKILILLLTMVIFTSCEEDNPKTLQKDYETVQYRILQDSTIVKPDYPIYRRGHYDYVIVDKKVVATYNIDNTGTLLAFIFVALLSLGIGIIIGSIE
jgi:hypothetical protein